jgi:hypothetical protein
MSAKLQIPIRYADPSMSQSDTSLRDREVPSRTENSTMESVHPRRFNESKSKNRLGSKDTEVSKPATGDELLPALHMTSKEWIGKIKAHFDNKVVLFFLSF